MSYQHFHLAYEAGANGKGQILFVGFNRAAKSTNTISEEVLDELGHVIDEASRNKGLQGLVIHSLKENGFIAGADVEGFKDLNTYEKAKAFLEKGQQVFDKLEQLTIPTVAMIRGFCMGGGAELALACRYRIACDEDKTRIGLPEVKLGIHPGWGGTVRAVEKLGPLHAMDLMLSGRTVRATQARRMGLVDAAVPLRQLKRSVLHFIENKPTPKRPALWLRLLNEGFPRKFLAKYFEKQVAQKALREHYPSPYAIIDLWRRFGGKGQRAYREEIESITRLIGNGETVPNLIRVFFLQERLKGLAKQSEFKAKHVHVVGAGTMGGDIAAWCALRGMRVTLEDREIKYIAPAIGRACKLYKKKLKKPQLVQQALDRLIPDPKGLGAKQADIIIEAIFEDLNAKQALFKRLEAEAKPEAILATNTSSIPLDEINQVMTSPERLVGVHFFNPVAMMPLVEIVVGDKTDPAIRDHAIAFVRQIDKLPLPVKSKPGFLVNRVLMPYLMEAVALVEEGLSMEEIDKAATKFGMPMGPVELADRVGLDVCLSVAQNLLQYYGGKIPDKLHHLVKTGDLGFKTNRGFYQYKNGKPVKQKSAAATTHLKPNQIADRLILRMLNEAAACLREGIVADEELLDAGMIFGTGFAPFRGGLIQYAHSIGFEQLCKQYKDFEAIYGERFKADAGIEEIAQEKAA